MAVAIWNSVEHNPAYADMIAVLQEHVGTAAADALRLPYSLGDAEEVTTVLEKSGFDGICIDTRLARYAGPSGEAVFPTSAHVITAVKGLSG